MPTKPVTVRRWEVVASFFGIVLLAIGLTQWNDYRIDQAEKRITRNAVRNAAQDEVRRQLLVGLRSADMRACVQIETLKAVVRPDPFDETQARDLLVDLGIDPDSERGQRLLEQGRISNARERRELAPIDC